ncbi:hypothetical protein MMC15_001343 [Xylographa vitiligo]|nr:hypothetical protein [Xylographa vitiligo]
MAEEVDSLEISQLKAMVLASTNESGMHSVDATFPAVANDAWRVRSAIVIQGKQRNDKGADRTSTENQVPEKDKRAKDAFTTTIQQSGRI